MSQSEIGHGSAMDLHSLHVRAILDALLESGTVLTISLFTVVMIVTIATSVNSHIGPVDLWSQWMSAPVVDMTESAPTATELAAWIETSQQAGADVDSEATINQESLPASIE